MRDPHAHAAPAPRSVALAEGLLPLSQTAMRFAGHVAYHEYEGPGVQPRRDASAWSSDLGDKNAMILRNHGLLVCAPSIPQAFNLIYWLEQACKIQVDILSCDRPLHVPAKTWSRARPTRSRARRSRSTTRTRPTRTSSPDAQKGQTGYGLLEWPALLRAPRPPRSLLRGMT